MIGIFALAGRPPSELADCAKKLSAGMASNPSWDVQTTVTENAACGRVGPGRQGTVWRSTDGSVEAWLDGFAFSHAPGAGGDDRVAGAGDLAEALLASGSRALLGFQGEFLLLVLDRSRRRLLAATDRFGIRTTYYYTGAGGLAVASELAQLIRLGLVPRKMDQAFVWALLRYNKCRMDDRTLFDGVSVVPPGTVLEFDLTRPGRSKNETYYRHEPVEETRTIDEWVEAVLPELRRSVTSSLAVAENGQGAALALSGGLDARLLLGALSGEEKKSIYLLSCGLSESSEVGIARKIAERAGGTYRNVDLGPSDFLSEAKAGVGRNEEFDIFVQGAQAVLHRAAAGIAGVLTTGWDLDVPLRGTYLDGLVRDSSGEVDVKATIDAKWSLFSGQELANLLQAPFHDEAGPAAENLLEASLDGVPQMAPLQRYLQFIFLFEKRRLLMLRNRMIRFEIESTVPFYHTRLQTLLAGIPEALKADDGLFSRVLNALSPELSEIPYQRTLLPADVPVEFWRRARDLEERKEELLREIFVRTGKRIPYTRYYSNFDEWLLSDREWMGFVGEMLDSKRTVITEAFVKKDALKRLLEENRRGPRSHRAKIIYLLSLELYLREYFV